MTTKPIRFAFFGTEPLARAALEALAAQGLVPALVVASADRILRDKSIAFPPEKAWAIERNIPIAQPQKIDDEFLASLSAEVWDVFVVASYGKILPKALLDMPAHGTINLHPSLLPRLRGPSPIRSAILEDEKEVGVSIMLLDDKMDHGPLLAQKKVAVPQWPPRGRELDALLAQEGSTLLAEMLPRWVAGEIDPTPQDHSRATYCKVFTKEDAQIDLRADAYRNLLKIRAFEGWPGAYALFERAGKTIRAKITEAHIERGSLAVDRVIPEGKREMSYADFMRT